MEFGTTMVAFSSSMHRSLCPMSSYLKLSLATFSSTGTGSCKTLIASPQTSDNCVQPCCLGLCAVRANSELKAPFRRHEFEQLHWPIRIEHRFSLAARKNKHFPSRLVCGSTDGDDFTTYDSLSDFEEADLRSNYQSAEEGEQSDSGLPSSADEVDLFRTHKDGQAKSVEEGTIKGLMSPIYEVSTFETGGSKMRVGEGIWITALLFLALCGTLLLVDSYIWRVIRRPLASFYLTYPFLLSAILTGYLGYLSVPLLKRMKAHQIFREEIEVSHVSKVGTPTMGGLFFVPVGVGVARFVTGFASNEVWGVAMATLAFAAIGLVDDGLTAWRNEKYGLPGWMKFVLQVAFGTCFAFWLDSASLPSPYKMKTLVPLPPPLGLWYCGKYYLPLTVFCFAAMSNGVNLTDGLDGLAGGTAAIAFIAMAIAVLPIYPALGIFGASMAGACVGFLVHNGYKATVFMGDTGSLALGAALAAMAACSGMFLPLFIASGVFVVETVSVVGQVTFFKLTRRLYGQGRRWLRMAPFHHHLELLGFKEPFIIAFAYALAISLALVAAYVGLICA